MSDRKTVNAGLSIDVFVDCPYCNTYMNLMDETDTDGVDHNEEGSVVSQACPNGHWSEEHEKFTVKDVKCSACSGVFNVKGLEW